MQQVFRIMVLGILLLVFLYGAYHGPGLVREVNSKYADPFLAKISEVMKLMK